MKYLALILTEQVNVNDDKLLSSSLKRILLIHVYTRSGTLHWFVVVALPYYILWFLSRFGYK